MHYLIHWGEAIFRWVVRTSWQAAVLVCLILLVQWLLRKRLAPSWRYGLWLLLVVRLLMPVVPPSGLSIFNLAVDSRVNARKSTGLAGIEPHAPVNNFSATPIKGFGLAKESRPIPFGPSIPSSEVGIRSNLISGVNWIDIACCGWLVGVLFFASRLVLTDVSLRARLERRRSITDEKMTQLFDECRREFNFTRPVRIIESAEVESPGVYGLWRKWLLLPEGVFERFSREELRHTFLHELAHLKRRDLEVNWLMAFLQILHWFNPVIWLAFTRMRADREMAADALVLSYVSATENIAYGETIIRVAANLAPREIQPGLVGIAESKARLQERLRAVAGARVAKYWNWAAVGLVAILGGVGLTSALGTDQPKFSAAQKNSAPIENYAAGISGKVMDPHGHPVDKAQIAVYRFSTGTSFNDSPLPPSSGLAITAAPTPRIFNPKFGHPIADLPNASEPWNYCTTDVAGRFSLNDLDRALGLVAVSGSGFAWVATNEFSTSMTVRLEPWGRIEGTLWNFNELATNEPVRVSFADLDSVPAWGTDSGFSTRTDDHGRFVFDYVPAGHFAVNGAGTGERVTVKSGQMAFVNLGGSGRSVTGKFKIGNPDGGIDLTDEFRVAFFTPMVDYKEMVDLSRGKNLEELKALIRQPVRENTFTNFHVRPVQCAKDGSFRIGQVEPGKYALVVSSGKVAIHSLLLTGEREIEIPTSASKTLEPLDLGIIEVSLRSPSGSSH